MLWGDRVGPAGQTLRCTHQTETTPFVFASSGSECPHWGYDEVRTSLSGDDDYQTMAEHIIRDMYAEQVLETVEIMRDGIHHHIRVSGQGQEAAHGINLAREMLRAVSRRIFYRSDPTMGSLVQELYSSIDTASVELASAIGISGTALEHNLNVALKAAYLMANAAYLSDNWGGEALEQQYSWLEHVLTENGVRLPERGRFPTAQYVNSIRTMIRNRISAETGIGRDHMARIMAHAAEVLNERVWWEMT